MTRSIKKPIKENLMKDFNSVKKLALYATATVICVAGQSAWAHTGIKDVVQEGVVSYNALNLSHGCNGNGDSAASASKNLIATSVVFPNAADPAMAIVTKLDPTTGVVIETLDDLSSDIQGVVPGVGFTGLGLGHVQPNLFPNYIPKIDKNTLVGAHSTPLNRGFATHNGKPFASAPIWQEVTSSSALAPFKVGPVAFNTTSCALSLKVRVASVNYCDRGLKSRKDPARADVWIGHMTAKFNDPVVMPYTQDELDAGKFYWPTMTIARNLTTNPLPAGCGAGYNLAIEPADADIDANLPISYGKNPAMEAVDMYWPTKK
ncbi:MAG: hypothetical protein QX203_06990 [Methylococcaceae bacterium]